MRSASVDRERREDALFARVEKGKALLLRLQDVLRYETDGLSEREMARRMDIDRRRVAVWRWVLGLSTRVPEGALRSAMASAAKRNGGASSGAATSPEDEATTLSG